MVTPLNSDWANWQNMLLDSVCKNIFLCFVIDSSSLQECSLFRNSYGYSRTCLTHPHGCKHKYTPVREVPPFLISLLSQYLLRHTFPLPAAGTKPQMWLLLPPHLHSFHRSAVSDIVLAGAGMFAHNWQCSSVDLSWWHLRIFLLFHLVLGSKHESSGWAVEVCCLWGFVPSLGVVKNASHFF